MKLYGYRNGRTLRALWALEEVGTQYEYVELDLKRGEAREAWFLAMNPAGKVPVLVHGGAIITESAAICMHLADEYPESRLLPSAATSERTECYKWVSFILTELDAPLWTIAKHKFALPRERRVPEVVETAEWEFGNAVAILASAVLNKPFLVGAWLTVADILAGHVLLWAKSARIPLGSDALETYLATLCSRDAVSRAQAIATAST